MRYHEIILEKVGNDNLYHFASLMNGENIIETDTLGRADSVLSMTRDSNHDFMNYRQFLFVISREKLRHRIALTKARGDDDFEEDHNREAEERATKVIKPLSKYLREIVIKSSCFYDDYFKKMQNLLFAYCQRHGIPISVADFGDDGSWFKKRMSLADYLEQRPFEDDYVPIRFWKDHIKF